MSNSDCELYTSPDEKEVRRHPSDVKARQFGEFRRYYERKGGVYATRRYIFTEWRKASPV